MHTDLSKKTHILWIPHKSSFQTGFSSKISRLRPSAQTPSGRLGKTPEQVPPPDSTRYGRYPPKLLHRQAESCDALAKFLSDVIAVVQTADGCVSCQPLRDHLNPLQFVILEEWEGVAAHQQGAGLIPRRRNERDSILPTGIVARLATFINDLRASPAPVPNL
jgi:hypothetical protein